MYNKAYALFQMGKKSDATKEMENALAIATESSESRHQVIRQAMDQMKVLMCVCLLSQHFGYIFILFIAW